MAVSVGSVCESVLSLSSTFAVGLWFVTQFISRINVSGFVCVCMFGCIAVFM